jgi:ribosomal protein L31E
MENPLADFYLHEIEKEKRKTDTVLCQTELTRVQLHDRKTLKNKKKLSIAIKEIRDFADRLEAIE